MDVLEISKYHKEINQLLSGDNGHGGQLECVLDFENGAGGIITINNPGEGYLIEDILILDTAPFEPDIYIAVRVTEVSETGAVLAIEPYHNGAGYIEDLVNNPTVYDDDSETMTGSGLTLDIVMYYRIHHIDIINPGQGYYSDEDSIANYVRLLFEPTFSQTFNPSTRVSVTDGQITGVDISGGWFPITPSIIITTFPSLNNFYQALLDYDLQFNNQRIIESLKDFEQTMVTSPGGQSMIYDTLQLIQSIYNSQEEEVLT